MTSKECDDLINKAVASGVLDLSGDLNFNMRGSREEIIAGISGKVRRMEHADDPLQCRAPSGQRASCH